MHMPPLEARFSAQCEFWDVGLIRFPSSPSSPMQRCAGQGRQPAQLALEPESSACVCWCRNGRRSPQGHGQHHRRQPHRIHACPAEQRAVHHQVRAHCPDVARVHPGCSSCHARRRAALVRCTEAGRGQLCASAAGSHSTPDDGPYTSRLLWCAWYPLQAAQPAQRSRHLMCSTASWAQGKWSTLNTSRAAVMSSFTTHTVPRRGSVPCTGCPRKLPHAAQVVHAHRLQQLPGRRRLHQRRQPHHLPAAQR